METLGLETEEPKSNQNDFELANQVKSGASWFYWIAGLSLVNSIIGLFGGGLSFIAGLGFTQIIDGIIFEIGVGGVASVVKIIAFVVELAIAGIFVGLGVFANKLQSWAFILGIVLYFLDGVLILALGAYLAAGFHVFALIFIVRGFLAARKLTNIADETVSGF
jgi:hypothetical protein